MKKCFVLMGFGEKTDYQTNRKLNLDKTYTIIKSAVEKCGLECVRADDIIHSGVIDKPMYEHLFEADLAIADLSTSNVNAIYELGVRHALRPNTTIIIAEEQFEFPFDLASVVIDKYQHLGSGIDFEVAAELEKKLIRKITELLSKSVTDSPVYTFLHSLHPPYYDKNPPDDKSPPGGDVTPSRGAGGMQVASLMYDKDVMHSNTNTVHQSMDSESGNKKFSDVLQEYHDLRSSEKFMEAISLAEILCGMVPNDVYPVQQLALVTYKSKQPDVVSALERGSAILQQLNPVASDDPETLGIWGAINKGLWEQKQETTYLDNSLWAYERGFYMRQDYYTGINYAFMLDVRASVQKDQKERITDQVIARRVRRRVLDIVSKALVALPRMEDTGAPDPHEQYWLAATRLEALYGLGEYQSFKDMEQKVFDSAPEGWMIDTTKQQIQKLRNILRVPPGYEYTVNTIFFDEGQN